MRRGFIIMLIVCFAGLLLMPAHVLAQAYLSSQLDTVTIGGRNHVNLATAARIYHLKTRSLNKGKTLEIGNATAQFTLTAESIRAQVNGIDLWLSRPVVVSGSRLYVSELDWRATLQPLLFPSSAASAQKIKTIVLDPGHGGKDTGNRVGGEDEKKHTLLLAQEVRSQLQQKGFNVKLTRTSDKYVDLDTRPALARRSKADLFVSLHYNATASGRSEVRGTEVYCLTPAGATSTNARGKGDTTAETGNRCNPQNVLLAYHVQKNLLTELASSDRGIRRARFAVLCNATMPAILVEAGFMSHPVEGRKIFDASYRKRIARAIVDGILAYRKAIGG